MFIYVENPHKVLFTDCKEPHPSNNSCRRTPRMLPLQFSKNTVFKHQTQSHSHFYKHVFVFLELQVATPIDTYLSVIMQINTLHTCNTLITREFLTLTLVLANYVTHGSKFGSARSAFMTWSQC